MGKTKICTSCGNEKELHSGFYAHPKMADGHLNKCKDCVKSRVKKHRVDNDHVREYDRNRYYNNPERRDYSRKQSRRWIDANKDKAFEQRKIWRQQNPEKQKAHNSVAYALRARKLTKEPCVVCGNLKSEAHHEDYSKPLEVIWLCRIHHMERHRQYEAT